MPIVLIVVLALLAVVLLLGAAWEHPEKLKQRVKTLTQKTTDSPAEFRAWAEESLAGRPELKAWLLSLPEEGLAALTQRVAAFCADLDWRLAWLLEKHIEVVPELRQSMETAIADYLDVCRLGLARHGEMALFGLYRQLVAHPSAARHRDLRRRLFTRLTQEGLAEPIPTHDLIMASETQRQELAAAAIQTAAVKDWAAVARILGEIRAE